MRTIKLLTHDGRVVLTVDIADFDPPPPMVSVNGRYFRLADASERDEKGRIIRRYYEGLCYAVTNTQQGGK